LKKFPTSFNRYFFLPLVLWWIVGGILLLGWDKQALFAFANTHYSPIGNVVMYALSYLGEGLPIAVMLLFPMCRPSYRSATYMLIATLCMLLPTLVTQIIKHYVAAPRPMLYFQEACWIHHVSSWPKLYHHSFPSGHSTGAFSLFCFLSFLLGRPYRIWGLFFLLLACGVGYARMYLAAHFFADVYAGSIIGPLCVLLGIKIKQQIAS
jgi:membrane-associated phospholipid phosphatase